MVAYGAASDFYFSGHTGFFFLLIRETIVYTKQYHMLFYYFGFVIFIVFMVLLFRVHFTIGKPW